MCGICGEITFDQRPADEDAVTRMRDHLAPRGPDGAGAWADGRIALGHRRLAIVDRSEAGAQPFAADDLGLVGVYNGMIYNYRELRAELAAAGYRFRSTCDTEVLLAAYHRWGERFAEHLQGMFAAVLVERESGRVVLVRDRLGVKPLYLARTPGRLRFASTLPALVAAGGFDTGVDPVGLHHFLSWRAVGPAPRTVLRGAEKLPPATVRVVEPDGTARDRVYWSPAYERRPEHRGWSAADWADAVQEALGRAVARRMVADVGVGVLLSGGIDSSLVVALLAAQGQAGVQTFSVGFEDVAGTAGDEFAYSDAVARRFGTDHHRIRVSAGELVDLLPHTVGAMSEPMVSHDAVAFDLLSREVAPHVRVVQTGQGADEVFGGYRWHPPLLDVDRADAADTYVQHYLDRDASDLKQLLQPEWLPAGDPSRAVVDAHTARPGATTALDAALRLDTEVMLVDDPLMRVDSMSMAWGVEAREPFLDHELVELAAACPPELKAGGGGKGVLRAVARRLVPASVVDRPKGYFPVPAVTHLDGPVLDLVQDALGSRAARERGVFRQEAVDRLRADPDGFRTRTGVNPLWQIGVLELWLQQHGVG